jgi:Na+-transporting methylmalonyl-CoA/oxaloacetate decarboxylase gamma subunit
MIDWGLVAKVAGAGFGVTLLVLTLLSAIVWVVSLITRERESESRGEEKE